MMMVVVVFCCCESGYGYWFSFDSSSSSGILWCVGFGGLTVSSIDELLLFIYIDLLKLKKIVKCVVMDGLGFDFQDL